MRGTDAEDGAAGPQASDLRPLSARSWGASLSSRALVPPIPPNATPAPAPRQCGLLVLANGGWLYSNGRWLGLGARVCT